MNDYRFKLTGDVSDKVMALRTALRTIKREYILSTVTHYVSTAGCAINELWFYVSVPANEMTKAGLEEALSILTKSTITLEEVE